MENLHYFRQMNRYFIELAYMGTGFSGFQIQENAPTIQLELQRAMETIFRTPFELTGSSRTDAGVHAYQNYFHFDTDQELNTARVYNINALLPPSIVVKSLVLMHSEAHCRFDAVSRWYQYTVCREKDPFMQDRSYYYPYALDLIRLNEAAALLSTYQDFTSFSKRNSQVKTHICTIKRSFWEERGNCLVFNIEANRFLRGMVRGLTGTQLQVGRGKLGLEEFRGVIEAKDATEADFAVPGHGLSLCAVRFPEGYFDKRGG